MTASTLLFNDLGLSGPVLTALKRVGYEQPTPIQEQSIPPLLEGQDLLGTAQTGTGKTAAFALPLLSLLNTRLAQPQALVLTPTRELAIQVAEAFQTYGGSLPGFHVLPIYGGQSMGIQLRQLSRGPQVVVGTPGRVMDHLRRGTLKLDALKTVVLDEADEMLRMGFIDDVEWILEHTPQQRQVALFSATMPTAIRKVADTYLKSPVRIRIESRTSTVERVEQKYWIASGASKLDALTRILEVEPYDGVIVFVRTKLASVDLADRLEARGHAAAAINGDMTQKLREATIARLKNGKVDLLVATDVAARGIDVARISHVINYDIPYDTEAYVHRIGRTGRAGRTGTAILFVAPRERRLLGAIERATRQKMTPMVLPSQDQVDQKRILQLKQQIDEALAGDRLEVFLPLIDECLAEPDADPRRLAAALAQLAQRGLAAGPRKPGARAGTAAPTRAAPKSSAADTLATESPGNAATPRMELFRIEAGRNQKVQAGDIVGAIANEAELDSQYIGRIRLFDDFSTVELPAGMPKELLQLLRKVQVRNTPLNLARLEGEPPPEAPRPRKPAKPRPKPRADRKQSTPRKR